MPLRKRIPNTMPHTVSRLADQAVIVRILAIRNGSRWFATSDQAEKNRSVKNVLLEKEEHDANSTTRFP
jgi:hypothetical protein